MIGEVIGVQVVDYTRKKDQKHIAGVRTYCAYDDHEVQGKACAAIYTRKEDKPEFKPVVGDLVNLEYDRFGTLRIGQ